MADIRSIYAPPDGPLLCPWAPGEIEEPAGGLKHGKGAGEEPGIQRRDPAGDGLVAPDRPGRFLFLESLRVMDRCIFDGFEASSE
jgi:hypothetical protein